MRIALLVATLAWVAPAAAQQKITIAPFTGPAAASARNQVVAALCELATCVSQTKVVARGKPDWKKAAREGVDFVVTGKVAKKGKKVTLELQVQVKPGKAKWKKAYPLAGGELSAASLSAAVAGMSRVMGLDEAPPPRRDDDAAARRAQEEEEAERERKKKAEAEERKRQDEEERARQEKERERASGDDGRDTGRDDGEEKKEEEDAAPQRPAKHHVLAADLGVELFGKYFSYAQPVTLNLRSYNAPLAFAPSFKAEFYPLALGLKGLLAGLGIEGGAAFSVGLRSRLPAPAGAVPLAYPTSILRIDAGLKWRIRPINGSELAIVALAGMRHHSFSVGAAEDGSRIDGLPGVAYTGLRLGVGGDLPLVKDRVLVTLQFQVLPMFSSGEIVSAAWFPRGGTFGIDAGLGLNVRVIGPLGFRVAGYLARYGITFQSDPADTYVAAGAVDLYVGGFAGVRLEL